MANKKIGSVDDERDKQELSVLELEGQDYNFVFPDLCHSTVDINVFF